MTRPNILVIQADQMTALCLSAYGKPYAITPNIDKMAENGTTFANSYCNNPVCGPSRASMMTGRLPSLSVVRHIRNAHAALQHQFLDLAQGHVEPGVEPDNMSNDLRRKPVAFIADFLCLHRHRLRPDQ